jgi:hypothetical protein
MYEAAVLTQEVAFVLNNPTADKLRELKLKVMAQMMDESDQT